MNWPRGSGRGFLAVKLWLLSALLSSFRAEDVSSTEMKSGSGERKDHPWDHLTFTQQWPPSSCIIAGRHHKCVIPSGVKTWTVHGLWPSLGRAKGPCFCNDSWHFDMSEIRDLESKLNVSWPNLFADTSLTSLWKHEWTKHGTCAASSPALRGEHNYFKTSLDLRAKYPIGDIFSQHSIYPSKTKGHKLGDISAALTDQLGGKVVSIHCFFTSSSRKNDDNNNNDDNNDNEVLSASTKRQYLHQVEICLDKQLRPIDCPDSGTCSGNQPVYYPPRRKPSAFSLFGLDVEKPYLVL